MVLPQTGDKASIWNRLLPLASAWGKGKVMLLQAQCGPEGG